MTWVRRSEPPPPDHKCGPPTHYEPIHDVADGAHGDLWRCDECKRLWRNDAGKWEHATLWQRMWHAGAGWDGPAWAGSNVRRGQQVISTAALPPRPDQAPPPPLPSGGCRHDR